MEMASLQSLTAQLNGFVKSLLDEGIVDSQFAQVRALQDETNPSFVTELIVLFCGDAEKIIVELNKYLGHQNVDFSKLESYIHQLKGSSSSIGAQRLAVACTELRQASEEKNKGGCLQALNTLRNEYRLLRDKFQTLIQLERGILAIKTNKQIPDANGVSGSA